MTELLTVPSTFAPAPPVPVFPTDLPYDDGEPLDSPLHRWIIDLLCEQVDVYLSGRTDYYVGGNMFIHFSVEHVRNRDFRGPDFFFVNGPDRDRSRKYYAIWEEGGLYPNVIVELLSSTTEKEDLTTKKNVYERIFKTQEYYCYDPADGRFFGWRLGSKGYEPVMRNVDGTMDCQVLGLKLGPWVGTINDRRERYLRFIDQTGKPVPTFAEKAEAHVARAEAYVAKAQAHAAISAARAAKADALLAQAQFEAATEKTNAAVAEAELAKLRAEIESMRQKSAGSAEQP